MLSVGFDIGSSSIKCAIIDTDKNAIVASGFYPRDEMKISSPKSGWAEQDPNAWWENAKTLFIQLASENKIDKSAIKSIGISYQMHGLVLVDKNGQVIRPSIIWCDSRAVEIGDKAFDALGHNYCLNNVLNSPGNFTASKLRWVKENEKETYKKIYKFMLPGDYIAYKLTEEMNTTVSGLSEGIFWDFKKNKVSDEILKYYEIDENFIPKTYPSFAVQGHISKQTAAELGLKEDAVVSYRAGDQPNNALSLNVLNPGEIAATGGTSGVVYGVIDKVTNDPLSRVNLFAHVNHTVEHPRIGVLLCINGTGIQNAWVRKNAAQHLSYSQMNEEAGKVSIGSDGLVVLPFGNGAERMLANKSIGGQIYNLDFNTHTTAHLIRAAQEGIAFSFKYGIDIMTKMGLQIKSIKAGNTNMFLSPIFRDALSNIANAAIELYDTDGAAGAARGAALGAGYYKSYKDAFGSIAKVGEVNPDPSKSAATNEAYNKWLERLNSSLGNN